MPINIQSLGVHELSVRERLDLIEQIWETLPAQLDLSEMPEWHRDELAKRRTQAEAAPAVGTPYREVLDRLQHGQ
ncbi:MAG TPA: addiction module protein [Pirellulales bacterium]|nr:addiction module protein [Pirellulales bacterium]